MATASESTPVWATKRSASSGSVHTIPDALRARSSSTPMVPSSPSTQTPTACATRTACLVAATFSAKGLSEPSSMTEVNPARIATRTWSRVAP